MIPAHTADKSGANLSSRLNIMKSTKKFDTPTIANLTIWPNSFLLLEVLIIFLLSLIILMFNYKRFISKSHVLLINPVDIFKECLFRLEVKLNFSSWAITMLFNQYVCNILFFCFFFIVILAVDKHHYVGILFD